MFLLVLQLHLRQVHQLHNNLDSPGLNYNGSLTSLSWRLNLHIKTWFNLTVVMMSWWCHTPVSVQVGSSRCRTRLNMSQHVCVEESSLPDWGPKTGRLSPPLPPPPPPTDRHKHGIVGWQRDRQCWSQLCGRRRREETWRRRPLCDARNVLARGDKSEMSRLKLRTQTERSLKTCARIQDLRLEGQFTIQDNTGESSGLCLSLSWPVKDQTETQSLTGSDRRAEMNRTGPGEQNL